MEKALTGSSRRQDKNVDIALVQTARTPALWSFGAATVQPVALSQRGAAGGRHTALCRCERHPSVHHHMAGFPVDVCVNVNREGSRQCPEPGSLEESHDAGKVFTCGVFLCFSNLLSLITIWLVFCLFVFCLGVFLVFRGFLFFGFFQKKT